MILTGVNMMDNKIWGGLCAALSCSMVFSENAILWDFGVIINSPNYHNISQNPLQTPSKQKMSLSKINAVISDPFIPPVKNSLLSHNSKTVVNNVPYDISALYSEKNIFQIINEAKKYYLKKNYRYVIALLHNRDLTKLTQQNRHDLEYLLVEALYHTGDYKKARDQVLSLLKQNEMERLYLLLAMIYESLGENNKAKEYYLKLIDQYPKSDYVSSAQIKFRILGRH